MAPKRKQTNAAAAAETVVRRSARISNNAAAAPAADPQPPKKKAKAKAKAKAEPKPEADSAEAPPSPAADGSKTVVIEHCKQCRSFKTRADQVKEALEKDVAGVKVVVNPEKPRRGCFEIREEGGEVFVSLLDLKRPFPPLKALDMEKVIADIVEKIR